MKFDMHVHTTLSPCSQLGLSELLQTASDKGLDGVCITDHDTMALRLTVAEGRQTNGLCLIIGMEYTTPEGDFLLFGPFEDLASGLEAPQLLRLVNERGGAAVAAHPFRRGRKTGEYLIKDGLCSIIEGINGRNKTEENRRTAAWRDSYAVGLIGGSDAHSAAELGRSTTVFHVPIQNSADMVKALKSGEFTMTRSIAQETVDDCTAGEIIRAA